MKEYFVGTLLIVLGIVAVIFWPFATIWALNTLFGLGIAYTFWTWLAVIVLFSTATSGIRFKR